jgi:hypothetical protein
VNRDGVVDESDLDQVVVRAAEQYECEPGVICWEDVNFDCVVNKPDIKQVMAAFGTCGAGGAGDGLLEMLEVWLTVGGEDALYEGRVTAGQVGSALAMDTDETRMTALFDLIEE